jgi:hypothetical protein
LFCVLNALRDGDALLASDGSFLQTTYAGTHAYKLISKSDMTMHILGAAKSPNSNKMSSAPTEHYGAIAVLVVLIVLAEHHKVPTRSWPDVTLLIDNKEVVTRGNNLSPTFMNVCTYLMHDYDLWMVIVELQKYLKFGVNFEWIKSHQCSSQSSPPTNDEIKLQEQKICLNDDVNKLATAAYTDESDYVERGAFYSGEVCYHQDGAHIQDISKAISSIDSDYAIIQYYLSKGWSMDRLKRVEWVGMEKFLSNQSPITRCNTIQMMHDWQNTGLQKKKFYEQSASLG